MRPIETDLVLAREIVTKGERQLDAIATRRDVYGVNGLTRIFQIFDFNIVAFKESSFDLTKIRRLKIPV